MRENTKDDREAIILYDNKITVGEAEIHIAKEESDTTTKNGTKVTYNKIVTGRAVFYRLSLLCLGELCHCFRKPPSRGLPTTTIG